MKRRSQRKPGQPRELDKRIDDALTDLRAYALTLDVECHRLGSRVLELAQQDSSTSERRAVVQERDEIADELSAFRQVISELAQQFPRR
ncbi:MAG TPA: hypothetical protein VMJ65_21885 [Solirubrobacteraceae bacterium]|nr:hypothetical protein [Solirubrobacteraceae bacterium]